MVREIEANRASEVAEIASLREAVESERAAMVEQKKRIKAATPPIDEQIWLNVGGVRYETSRHALTRVEDSMLAAMFSERCEEMLQVNPEDGSIFIDRNGERFGLILDFLRDGDSKRLARKIRNGLNEEQRQAMMCDLDFFGLESAVFGVSPWFEGATFTPGPEMNRRRYNCAAVKSGQRVVVFGGPGDGRTTEVLDLNTNAFTEGPNMLHGRVGCAAISIGADRILVVGGGDEDDTTEFLDLNTLTFTEGPNMHTRRCGCAVVALDARRVLVIGGYNLDDGNNLSTTEVLDLETLTFTQGPNMLSARYGCAAVRLDADRILVAGGEMSSERDDDDDDDDDGDDYERLKTTEVFDINTMTFSIGPEMSIERVGCAAVSLDSKHVLIIGGQDANGDRSATTEVRTF